MKRNRKKSRRPQIPLLSLLVVLLVPLFCFLFRGPETEIEANTGPNYVPIRGNILDRTGTLLAYSKRDPSGAVKRIYPYGDMARAIIGEVDSWGRGIFGAELLMDELLSSNKDISLTLEREVQITSEEVLNVQMAKFNATFGCFIMMDANTGEILALSTRSRHTEDKAHIGEPLYLKALFHPGVLSVPIRWLRENEEFDGRNLKSGHKWVDIDSGQRLWSPWTKSTLQRFIEEKRSVTKELIDLGFGDGNGKVPIYTYNIFEEDFKSSPLNILRAFASLINDNGLISPYFVDGLDFPAEKRAIPWLDRQKRESLRELLSGFSTPSLASVWWKKEQTSGPKRCEIIALGYWPSQSPKVVYITAIKGASYDPIQRPGILSRARRALKLGAALPEGKILSYRIGREGDVKKLLQ